MLNDSRATGKQYIVRQRKQINYQTKTECPHGRFFGKPVQRRGDFRKKGCSLQTLSNLSRRTVGFVNEDGKGRRPGIQF